MSATQQKKWSPPQGWTLGEKQTFGDDTVVTGLRTYPDGTSREIMAHSEEEFTTLAARTDEETRIAHRNRRDDLREQVRVLKAQTKDLEQQAKQYDWA